MNERRMRREEENRREEKDWKRRIGRGGRGGG
jgi:hypothetical protein